VADVFREVRVLRILPASAILLLAIGAAAAEPSRPGSQAARLATAMDGKEARVEAALVALPPERSGEPLRIGVALRMDPGWHIYAQDPGETGLPTRVELSRAGQTIAPLHWPEPSAFREPDGPSAWGYSGEALIWAETAARAGPARAEVELLACADRCIPARFALEADVDPAAPPAADALAAFADAAPAAASGLLHALLLALLGGIILNVMPCVLPVLALKLAAAAELAHASRRHAAAHAAAYAGGVLVTLEALALLVVALREAGTQVGWGFHFQEPYFVSAVTAVVVLFGLNLLGLFEISWIPGGAAALAQRSSGLRRSFFEGLLAVVLATPCTAPFLGSAVGFAFAAGDASVFAVFAAIAAGLALPFVAVVLAPAAARLLPRPGAWMLELRASLGFLLLASAVWLLWVLGRAAGIDAVAAELALLLALAYAVRALGRVQAGAASGRWLLAGGLVAGLAVSGAGVVGMQPRAQDGARGLEFRAFDAAAVRAVVESGQPAFVYFTADWCLTCKLNERRVLADERVQAALERSGIARFRADWTRRDAGIARELERHGRAGVPLYLIYAAGDPDHPQLLPELLEVDLVLEALAQVSRAGQVRPAAVR
jgi:thiol:disulfide interchange protein DsbD